MKLKTLRTFEAPTDIIIFGSCNPVNDACDVSITDDYSSFDLSLNGKSYNNSFGGITFESDGFVSVVTLKEFLAMEFEDSEMQFEGGFDICLFKGFVGDVKLRIMWEDKEYDTIGIDVSDYIVFSSLLTEDDDEYEDDFYPTVGIDLVTDNDYTLIAYDEELHNKYLLNKERTDKLERLNDEM